MIHLTEQDKITCYRRKPSKQIDSDLVFTNDQSTLLTNTSPDDDADPAQNPGSRYCNELLTKTRSRSPASKEAIEGNHLLVCDNANGKGRYMPFGENVNHRIDGQDDEDDLELLNIHISHHNFTSISNFDDNDTTVSGRQNPTRHLKEIATSQSLLVPIPQRPKLRTQSKALKDKENIENSDHRPQDKPRIVLGRTSPWATSSAFRPLSSK